MKKNPLRPLELLVAGCVVVVVAAMCASNAEAHGPHHSFVSPDADCYEAIEGELWVTHDLDRNRYIKWRCVCIWTKAGYKVCYWKLISVTQALKNMWIPSNTKNYYQARIVTRRVHWMAWHGSNGCVEHFARRSVIQVRHR